MQKVIFVSHCILNTTAKVVMFNKEEIDAEEKLRKQFLKKAIDSNIQIIQLPCPEFTLYGSRRWGHVSNQFDNIFFKSHCKQILSPILDILKEYLSNSDRFQVLAFVGIDGSPSCGVDYTCCGDWYGSFENRKNIQSTLDTCVLKEGSGIMISVLKEMLKENNLENKIQITSLFPKEPNKCLNLI